MRFVVATKKRASLPGLPRVLTFALTFVLTLLTSAQVAAERSIDELLSAYVSQTPGTEQVSAAVTSTSQGASSPALTHLRAAIRRYERLAQAGGWPRVPVGPTLHPGAQGERVAIMRERLRITGDLRGAGGDRADVYDSDLQRAVRRFQLRHGLQADAIVGKSTIEAMNESVTSKVHRLRVNLRRLQDLPAHDGQHVVVNVPEFRMRLLDDRREVLSMNVVVGKRRFATPRISDEIDYIVLNPYWNVPKSIALREVLPKVVADPNYLYEQQFEVLSGSTLVDPSEIAWQELSRSDFPYRFRQRPGAINALGSMKFIFPNPHNVYLHDTPVRWAFDKPVRAMSHGCIRLERPSELAQALLAEHPRVTPERIERWTLEGRKKVVNLPQPVPVDIVYLTAKADASMVWFFRDIYRRDEPDAEISEALAGTGESVNKNGSLLYATTDPF